MKRKGFTLMEMLIAVAIIAVVASLTIVVVSKIKRLMYDRTCSQKFVDFHQALTLYRMDWGNAHEVVGDGAFLGIPYDYNSALRFRGHDKWLSRNLQWNECPASVRGFAGEMYLYTNHVYDVGSIFLSFEDATFILKGETPLLVDFWHNELDHNYHSPRVNHKVIYLNLSGNVKTEIVSGIPMYDHAYLFLPNWVWLKAPDEYLEFMKNKNRK